MLELNTDKELYLVLGFLCKPERLVKVYWENNNQAGAWGGQGRLSTTKKFRGSLPSPLDDAFYKSGDNRISETDFVKRLIEDFGFKNEEGFKNNDFTVHLYPPQITDIQNKIPQEFQKDFEKGYYWKCETIKRVRKLKHEDANLDEETVVKHAEGGKKQYLINKHERSTKNRKEAIKLHGTTCVVCHFNFEEKYGEFGKGFIEVHHIVPLSSYEERVVINPSEDLVCICANCHRMMHRFKDYSISVDELRRVIIED